MAKARGFRAGFLVIIFWSLVASMTGLALLLVLPPVLRRGAGKRTARDEINLRIYRERLRELEADRTDGRLDAQQFEEARSELERELLQDLQESQDLQDLSSDPAVPARAAPGKGCTRQGLHPARVAPGKGRGRGRWAAGVIALAVPLFALGLYLQLGTFDAVVQSDAVATPEASVPTVQDMVASLAARLQEKPDDPRGWVLLGRSYIVLERFAEAAAAYQKAYQLIGDQPDLLADFAHALALAQGRQFRGPPQQLLERALLVAPDHPKTLLLAGLAAFQNGAYPTAIERWQRLLEQTQGGAQDRQAVEASIAEAKARLNGQSAIDTADATSKPPELARLQVRVTLSPGLAAQVAPDDTVFIFAHALKGPPMPLVVTRAQVKDLPLTTTLDDSMAMVPGMSLSRFPEVMVLARVSRTGRATPESGDLEGSTGPVEVARNETIEIIIDEKIP
jgi:cytochrome c-type biogenesis protein CcmI